MSEARADINTGRRSKKNNVLELGRNFNGQVNNQTRDSFPLFILPTFITLNLIKLAGKGYSQGLERKSKW